LAQARIKRLSTGRDCIDLTESNPTRVGLRYASDELRAALSDAQALRYEPAARGLRVAREAIASWYCGRGMLVVPDDLLLTASSSEAYALLLKLMCDPGDAVLVPRPSYPLFDHLAQLEDVRLVGYPLRVEDAWRIDVAALEHALEREPRCKAIFVVSPNNPTGSFLRTDERDTLERVACRHGLAIVCDEVFADYVWRDEPSRVRCAARDASVLTFSLGGLSKSACLPQLKLGWVIAGGPDAIRQEALARLEIAADTYLSVGASVQHGAARLLRAGEMTRADLAQRVSCNLRALRDAFENGSPASVLPCVAGWYALLRVPRIQSDMQWSVDFAVQDGVLVHPGELYGFEDQGYLVLGLIAHPALFDQGVRRLAAGVSRRIG
jgi:hypothetical protein